LYVYVIRQGPNQYPSCALTWTRTSLVQCTPRGCGKVIREFPNRYFHVHIGSMHVQYEDNIVMEQDISTTQLAVSSSNINQTESSHQNL
jgi:hypothetical protein